ncbi:MAG: hypothetical protein H8E42_13450 [Nitrospinae bacterium]|nr:hypothetical protein [Nitrospinota bacterium]MBL7021388.1 hypothetical protein [Nitrospinaceae bacterium]
MIDWSQCQEKDFSIVVDGEDIQQVGQTQLFPVRVFYKEETFAFMKSVPLRAEFYAQLRQRDDWKERLMEILKNRVREDIDEKIRSNRVGIDDKLELMAVGKNRIV